MQQQWTSALDTGWRRERRQEEEWRTPSESVYSNPSSLDSPLPPLPSRPSQAPTPPLISSKDQQELSHLLENWHSDGIKLSVAMSIPMLVSHVFDDEVFLKLPSLETLPHQSPKIDALLKDDPTNSNHDNDGELNALQKYWMYICRYFCRRMKLSTTAFVLGIIFVHQYRTSTNDLVSRKGPSTNPSKPPIIYSANHLFLVAMMLSNKYTEDHPYPNSYWSRHFGIKVDQLNRLEQSFLQHLDHTIFIQKDTFNQWILCLNRLCQWLPMTGPTDPVRRNSRDDYPMSAPKSAMREPDCGLGHFPIALQHPPKHHEASQRNQPNHRWYF